MMSLGKVLFMVLLSYIAYTYLLVSPSSRTWGKACFDSGALILLTTLLWAIYVLLLYPYLLSPLRHLPTVPQKTWLNLSLADASPLDYERWTREIPNDGLIRYRGPLNREKLLVTSVEGFREATQNTHVVQRTFSALLEMVVGRTSILLTQDEIHRVSRKKVQPAFGAPHIKEMYPIFWMKAAELARALSQEIGSSGSPATVNVKSWFSRLSLDAIGLAGFSTDFNSVENPRSPLAAAYRRTAPSSKRGSWIQMLVYGLLPEWRWLHYRLNYPLFQANLYLKDTAKELISKRLDHIRESGDEKVDERDVLGLTIRNETCTIDELVDYCLTFLAAGQETTSASLVWAIYALTQNPSIQSHLRSEIRTKIPSPSTNIPITPSHIDKVPYLTAFINEVLRFHAPVPKFNRATFAPITIAGTPLPTGTKLVLCTLAANRDPALWRPSPTTKSPATIFDPTRWLDTRTTPPTITNGGATSLYSNMTFSHGPKNCIGERFARAQIAVVLAVMVGKFDFKFRGAGEVGQKLEDAKKRYAISHEIMGGLWVEIQRVDGW